MGYSSRGSGSVLSALSQNRWVLFGDALLAFRVRGRHEGGRVA